MLTFSQCVKLLRNCLNNKTKMTNYSNYYYYRYLQIYTRDFGRFE